MLREAVLDGRLELDDSPPQLRRHLVRVHLVVKDVELPAERRIVGRVARSADGLERGRVGQEVGARELRLDTQSLGLLARFDVRVPPGAVGGNGERPQAALELGDDVGRAQ